MNKSWMRLNAIINIFAFMHVLVFLLIFTLSHACNLDQKGPLLFSPFLPAENMLSERQTKTY